MLKQAVETYDFFGLQIRACDAELEKLYAALSPRAEEPDKPLPPSKRTRRKAGCHDRHDCGSAFAPCSASHKSVRPDPPGFVDGEVAKLDG